MYHYAGNIDPMYNNLLSRHYFNNSAPSDNVTCHISTHITNTTTTTTASISNLEDELMNLLDVIEDKGIRLRNELDDAQLKVSFFETVASKSSRLVPNPEESQIHSDPIPNLNVAASDVNPSANQFYCDINNVEGPISFPFYDKTPFIAKVGSNINSNLLQSRKQRWKPSSDGLESSIKASANTANDPVIGLISRASLAEREASEANQRVSDLHSCLSLVLAEKRRLETELRIKNISFDRNLLYQMSNPEAYSKTMRSGPYFQDSCPPGHYGYCNSSVNNPNMSHTAASANLNTSCPLMKHFGKSAEYNDTTSSIVNSAAKSQHSPEQNMLQPRVIKIPIKNSSTQRTEFRRAKSASSVERKTYSNIIEKKLYKKSSNTNSVIDNKAHVNRFKLKALKNSVCNDGSKVNDSDDNLTPVSRKRSKSLGCCNVATLVSKTSLNAKDQTNVKSSENIINSVSIAKDEKLINGTSTVDVENISENLVSSIDASTSMHEDKVDEKTIIPRSSLMNGINEAAYVNYGLDSIAENDNANEGKSRSKYNLNDAVKEKPFMKADRERITSVLKERRPAELQRQLLRTMYHNQVR